MSIPETVPVEHRRHAKYERLIARAKEVPAAATLVVHPCDETSLRGAAEATQAGLITPTLIGPPAKDRQSRSIRHQQRSLPVIDAPHSDAASEQVVELIRQGKGELLMEGRLQTDELMRA